MFGVYIGFGSHWETIKDFDYAFIVDVDMIFVRPVGIEVSKRFTSQFVHVTCATNPLRTSIIVLRFDSAPMSPSTRCHLADPR